jgi:hypothetical protein
MGRFRRVLLAALLLALALASCGIGENHDPYALLDKAWSTGWEQVEVQLGFTLDTPNAGGGDMLPIPGHVQIDPSAVRAIIDTRTGQWRLSLSIPQGATGIDPLLLGLFGAGIPSFEGEILFDGASLFAKSPLLQAWLQPIALSSPTPIEGDLTGWVRLGSTEDLQSVAGAGNPLGPLMFGGALPGLGALPLPAQGDPGNLRQFFEDLGVVAEYKGTDQRNGRDAQHVAAGLDFEKLARSQRFGTLLNFGVNQLEGLSEVGRQVAIGADLWFDKETSRLIGFQVNVQTLQGQATKASIVLNLADPAVDNPFAAPATFTDVPITELMGGDNSGGGASFATPAPTAP